MFLTETHFHTALSSPCANVPPEEAVAMYADKGYATIVVTDHFSRLVRDHYGIADDVEWVDHFLRGYRHIRQLETPMAILLGMEIRFDENANDYLVFGFSEEDIYQYPDMYTWSVRQFKQYAEEKGWIILQAHPFREGMTVTAPTCIDGVEVYNGNPRHNSRNEMAAYWASINGFMKTAGSDYHQKEDLARGGLITDNRITTIGELIQAIRDSAGIYTCNK